MPISFKECRAILSEFKQARPEILTLREVHGIHVVCPADRPQVVILVSDELSADSVRTNAPLLRNLDYEFEGKGGVASVELRVSPKPRAHTGVLCHPGDPASGNPQSHYGTLGWNFYLNNVLVGLSNWHVFCAHGNDTPVRFTESINGSVEASLYAFQALYSTGNYWDYALAQYIQPTDAAGVMRLCENASEMPYPGKLSPIGSVTVGDGVQYYKVGARPPICRTGTLVGVGDVAVEYDDGVTRSFLSQLIFSKMTDPGDSGAVIVRETDTSVTGLNFAGNNTDTIANPIYLANWKRIGSTRFDGGAEIPVLVGKPVPVFDTTSTMMGKGDLIERSSANALPTSSALPQPFDLPYLSAGLLFLGSATKMIPRNGAPYYSSGGPPPPPIRPNVQVQEVTASSIGTAQGWTIETVFFFG